MVAPDELSPNRSRNAGRTHDPDADIMLGKSKSVGGPITPPKEFQSTTPKGRNARRQALNTGQSKDVPAKPEKERKWKLEDGDEFVGHRIVDGKRYRVIKKAQK